MTLYIAILNAVRFKKILCIEIYGLDEKEIIDQYKIVITILWIFFTLMWNQIQS